MRKFGLIERAKRRNATEGFSRLIARTYNKIGIQSRLLLSEHNFCNPKLTAAAIEVTNACNLDCGMCEIARKRRIGLEHPRFISLDFFEETINQLAELHSEVSLNFGGESLLHPQFKEIVTYAAEAQKRGLGKISWFDNATLFDSGMSELVVKLSIDEIVFSVDKLGFANNEWRKGSNITNIEHNIAMLKEIRGNNRKPFTLINKVDVEDREITLAFIRHWLNLVDVVQVSTYRQPIWRVYEPDKYYSGPPHYELKHCAFPFYFMGILADGRVTGCGCDASAENLLGNAFEDSLKKIWSSTRYKEFRKATTNHRPNPNSPCVNCDCWKRRFRPAIDIQGDFEVVYGETKVYRRKEVN